MAGAIQTLVLIIPNPKGGHMAIRADLRVALVIALFAAPLTGVAQKFQEPTREELQMKSDAREPDAPAVFLDWEQKTDNAGHYVSAYARVKVLQESGMRWAVVHLDPYNPQMSGQPIIEARTIHCDGTVIPLEGKTEEILTFKDAGPSYREATFTMPRVEVGSILEYRWTVPLTEGKLNFVVGDPAKPLYSSLMAKSTPTWRVQQTIPVYKASFYFNPFTLLEIGDKAVLNNATFLTGLVDGERETNLLFTERLPGGVHVAKSPKGEYFLTIENIPALPDEPNAPPAESRVYGVDFYYSPYAFPDVYWENEIKRWSKSVAHATEATTSIKEAANQLTVGTDTPEAKAVKLYDRVQRLNNTDLGPASVQHIDLANQSSAPAWTADEIWKAKSGSGNDLAILYLALADAAGLDAHAMKIASRDERIFDINQLSLFQLDSLVIVVRLGDKDVYLDPGTKFCPYGQLSWAHTLAGGIAEGAKTPTFTPPNDLKEAITAHTADLTVDAQGIVAGIVKVLMNGPEALRWRQLNLAADTGEVQKQIGESLHRLLPPGIGAEFTGIQGLDTSTGYVTASFKVKGKIATTGKHLLMPGFFFNTQADARFASTEKRETPIDLHFAGQAINDVVYHLPPGYSIESAPQSTQMSWPEHAALVVKTQVGPGTIEIKHIFARAFAFVDPRQYPALRDYYQRIATNDQQQLMLRQAVAAGN
jgi:hypothetical protein